MVENIYIIIIQDRDMAFEDRYEAGRLLLEKLAKYKGKRELIILAIPRGGLEIAFVIAKGLKAPLDVVVSKKIGFPGDPEFAIGAVCFDEFIVDESLIEKYDVPEDYVKQEHKRLEKELTEKYFRYTGRKNFPDLKGKVVILVDDGIATGETMRTAIHFVKRKRAKKIVVAVPVAPTDTAESLKAEVDDFICLETHDVFFGISAFYRSFPQVSDEMAIQYLKEANA